MRLTLRTLLSYLDNVLDEPARAELQRQIESSEHASEWIHRTRDVMRRLKLGAPEPGGGGSVDDPNTVAEYLDRTLPEPSVAEFERVCLDSDTMLAEVASCHHVLAMVLSEPAEVDPDTRRRLHNLQDEVAAAIAQRKSEMPAPFPSMTPPPQPHVTPSPSLRLKPEPAPVAKTEWASWAPAIAASLLLATTAMLAFSPGGWLNPAVVTVAENKEGAPVPPPVDDEPDQAAAAAAKQSEQADAADARPDEADSPAEQSNESGESDGEKPNDGADASTVTEDALDPPAVPEPETSAETPEESGGAAAADGDGAMPEEGAMPDGETPPVDAESDGPADDGADAEVPPPARLMFVGPPVSVVVVEKVDGPWQRLTNGMFMQAPERAHTVSLPAYRGTFLIDDLTLLELVDQTEAIVDPAGPGIQLTYGRIVLTRLEDATEPVTLRLQIDGVDYEAELAPGAQLSVAAERYYEPGRPLGGSPAPMVVIANAISGEVAWTSPAGRRTSDSPPPLFFVSSRMTGAPEGFRQTDWVVNLERSAADRQAAPALADLVALDKSVWPQLVQIAGADSRQEVRSLAARAAAALGHPEALVASFSEESQFRDWQGHLAALRQNAARSVAAAEAVRRAFTDRYGETLGGTLFQLVQGFDTIDPQEAEAILAPLLSSADLASRVLAVEVVNETFDFPGKPFDATEDRQPQARRFGRHVERGQMTAKSR